MVPLAIGSDTGGSVRIPASLCGIVGLKTSTGLVSMQGVAVLSHTFDTINPMARTVEDTTLALAALSDFTAASEPLALSELRFAVAEDDQLAPLEATVDGSRQQVLHQLASAGRRLDTLPFPPQLPAI